MALALVMGVVAFAENAEPTTDPVPTVTEEAPTEDTSAAAEADNTALQEALEAYRSARESKCMDDLTEELNGYVEAGTMTQEQADLILSYVKEWIAAKNGECPSCGYKFKNNCPQMGGQVPGNQQRGGNQQFGGGKQHGNQQRGGNQQFGGGKQPDAQSGATPQQPNGQMPDNQAQPDAQRGATPKQ